MLMFTSCTRHIREDSTLQCFVIGLSLVSEFINVLRVRETSRDVCFICRRFCKHLEIKLSHVIISLLISYLILLNVKCF